MAGDPSDSTPPPDGGIPLQLVYEDVSTGKLALGQEAVRVLRGLKLPLAVAAVAGRARTGKSYILNQILGSTAGFQVASTYKPCTRGLWLWSHPVKLQGLDGSPYYLVLIDTEGMDAYNQTTQSCVQLFSLAVLLSSLFIYNQMGAIDEAALERLGLVTELTRRIRVRSGDVEGLEDASSLAEFTPTFVWLLRDHYLAFEDHGVRQSPRDYLEAALMPTAGKTPAVEAKNMIRTSIKSLFPDRDCFTLVRPVVDEAALRDLSQVPHEQLRPEFADGVARLTALVQQRAQPKRLGAQQLTGPLLAGLAAAYIAAINEGAVPTIATAWHSVAESECRAACHAAEDAYKACFNEDVAADELVLQEEHLRALAAAKAAFRDRAVGDSALRAMWKARYCAACELAFEAVRERKLADASARLEEQLASAAGKLHTAVRLQAAPFDALAAAMEREVSGVVASSSGASRWPRLLRFMQDQYRALGGDVEARQLQAARYEAGQLQLQVEQARAAKAEALASLAAAERKIEALQQQVMATPAPWVSGAHGQIGRAKARRGEDEEDVPEPGRLSRWLGCFTA